MVILIEGRAHARDLAVRLINPDRAAHFLERLFIPAVGLGMLIAGEVEGNGVAPIQAHTARPGKGNNLQQACHRDFIFVRVAIARLRDLQDFFIDPVLFLARLVRGQILAIFATSFSTRWPFTKKTSCSSVSIFFVFPLLSSCRVVWTARNV